MFSFGTIKTATALGGGLIRVEDPILRQEMRRRQAQYEPQSRGAYLRRVCKYAGMKLLSARRLYGGFFAACRWLGQDPNRIVGNAVRGFAGPDFFRRIRRQPTAALLRMIRRRIQRFPSAALHSRRTPGPTAVGAVRATA